MAAGDLVLFQQFGEGLGNGLHDLDANTFKLGLITSAVTPTANMSDPRFGAGGGTNLATNEVTAGGNYSAGGPTLASLNWSRSGATSTWDVADVTIAQAAGNPTNARWAVIYNSTASNRAVGFIDLGVDRDLSAGSLTLLINAGGVFDLVQA